MSSGWSSVKNEDRMKETAAPPDMSAQQGEMLEDATLSAYLSVLQESALDSLPPSSDIVDPSAFSPTLPGKKRSAPAADQERLKQNAAAQKRYRMRQKNEKEQANEKHAALERRIKSLEDMCSAMQSQLAMLDESQRQMNMQQKSLSTDSVTSLGNAKDPAIVAHMLQRHSPNTPLLRQSSSAGCQVDAKSAARMMLHSQIPVEKMAMARIRVLLNAANASEEPGVKTNHLLRLELRKFWSERERLIEQLRGGDHFGQREKLLCSAMDMAPHGKVDIDQDLYDEMMRCHDKAAYTTEIVDRIAALRDSYVASMHTIRLNRLAINTEIIALMQQSEGSTGASPTASESCGQAETSIEPAPEVWEWQERTRSAHNIVEATQRLSTSLTAEREVNRTFLNELLIETLPPVVSAHLVLRILESKHRHTLRTSASCETDQAHATTEDPANLAWYPRLCVTLKYVTLALTKLLIDKRAAVR